MIRPDYSPVQYEKKLEPDDHENEEPVKIPLNHIGYSEDSKSNSQTSSTTGRRQTARKSTSQFSIPNRTRGYARKSTSPFGIIRGYASNIRYFDPPIEIDRADDFEPTILDG